MKKLLLFTLLASALMVKAQAPFSSVDGESVLVYSLPKTVFCIEIETEKISQKPGKFYRYSERYLATNKVITDSTSYESYKERLKTLIDIIKETNEVSYNTELRLYLLLCDTYYKTF